MQHRKTRTLFVTLIISLTLAFNAASQSTEFTYQGSLQNGGSAANGNYDFEFALFDTVNGGNQVGPLVARNNVAVANGIFTVQLGFGSTPFSGPNRFLEIRVRQAGQPGMTTLSPRRPVDSSPYSIRSLNADIANNANQLGGVAANQFVVTTDPRMSDARTPAPGSGDYVQNRVTQQGATNFNISGGGTVGGTLSANIVNAATQVNLGSTRVLSVSGSGNILAGVGAGSANTGSSNSFFGESAGAANTSGLGNSFFGRDAGALNMTGIFNSFFGRSAGGATTGNNNAFFGYGAGVANTSGTGNTTIGAGADVGIGSLTNATAIGANSQVDCANCLVLGSNTGVNGASATSRVGIGTTSPDTILEVVNNDVTTAASFFVTTYGAVDNAIIGRQAGGTRGGPTATPSGRSLMFLGGRGYTGQAGFATASRVGINLETAEAWTPNANGTRIIFDTTANGTAARTERMRIDDVGNVGIGRTDPTSRLHVISNSSTHAIIGGSSGAQNGVGVLGQASNGPFSAGIYGIAGSATNDAGYFFGDVEVNGTLENASGLIKIDHPLDPANKTLYHSTVASPEMKNIYDGNVTTDATGEAEVVLPDWFEALNRDFRYQLTVIGQFAQAIVAEKIRGNRFKIRTSLPNVEVSWQITGIRQDAYAESHRIPVEETKSEKERGSYLHPLVFGQPEEKGVEWVRRPEDMKRIKDSRQNASPAAGQPRPGDGNR